LARQYGFTERFELSGSEPQHDAQRPDEKPSALSSPPGLIFKPDARQAARVARVRMYMLMAAAVLMVIALVLIVSYRPPPMTRPVHASFKDTIPSTGSGSPASPQAPTQPAAELRVASGVDIARSAAAVIDTLVSAAAEKWVRAAELSPQVAVTRDNAQQAVEDLGKAVILADSARHDILSARQQAEFVLSASREVRPGPAFRLGVLYSAMDSYLKSMDEDATDRRAYYEKSEAAAKAMLLDDLAESEIQQNVAMSYLRKSEDRQAGIRRLADQMREALRNIDNVGR
jgi:hypothetical protein